MKTDLVFPGGGDLGIELWAGVQVMVVGCQSSSAQVLGLLRGEHA